MSQLLGMCFDQVASPSITPADWESAPDAPAGWGFAWYPTNEGAAHVVKDPHATGDTPMTAMLRDWDRFRSSVFLCHIRGAAQYRSLENSQPFQRSYGGRDWVMAHSGNLDPARARRLHHLAAFTPVGRTDTERAFCCLLTRANEAGYHKLSEIGWPELRQWLLELNQIGSANLLLSDGRDLVLYRDESAAGSLYVLRRTPPHRVQHLQNPLLRLEFDDPSDSNLSMILAATTPLSDEPWILLPPGAMLVARRGALIWSSTDEIDPRGRDLRRSSETPSAPTLSALPQKQMGGVVPLDQSAESSMQLQQGAVAVTPAMTSSRQRELSVVHTTTYRYTLPVEKSVSTLRLRPTHDAYQTLLEHEVQVSVDGVRHEYWDVFGNGVTRLAIDSPYETLEVVARSRVRVKEQDSLHAPGLPATLPLVWMPWQRQMMVPYLLPPELPEAQLQELTEYAMSFVERQDSDLVGTLLDINNTIRRDYAYVSHSTHLGTTPFDVYVQRRGVCQDFANLFICLARLLNVPARYAVGYIYTGSNYENQIQSEASHAWAEVYLPIVGWRGFDPTNGCVVGADHVRVASGRNYRDATPTSGTIFKGGSMETLNVEVRVEELSHGAQEQRLDLSLSPSAALSQR